MFKKLFAFIIAATLSLSMAGSAFATFADLELIRVAYERETGTLEYVSDLGNVNSIVANAKKNASFPGTTPSASNSANLYVCYWAINKATKEVWASGDSTVAPVLVGSAGYNSMMNGVGSIYTYYNLGTNGVPLTPDSNGVYAGSQSNNNSFKTKLDANQGALGNVINIATRPYTEANLASGSATQVLYYFSNATVAGGLGKRVATITNNTDGSTTISPLPAAATAPGKPSIGTATATGDGEASISFTPPASDGGSAITGYTVTSIPAGSVDSNAGSTALSHIITGLTNGTPYKFTVTATNTAGTGEASAESGSVTPVAPITAPGAPTGMSALAGNAQATVTFTAPASNGGSAITGYTVTSIPAGGVDSNAGSTALSHSITGLTNGTPYKFTVTATNTAGKSAASAESSPVTPAASATVPGAPTGISALAGNAQATVTFTAPASNGGSAITGYTVTSITAGGVDSNAGSTALSHIITGLTNGTPYKFTVTATNTAGTSAASAESSPVTPVAATAATAPGAPTGVTAQAGNTLATVTFTAPASNGGSAITGYTVTSIPAGGVDSNAGSTALSHIITGLTNGTPYKFTVTATNTAGTSAASAESSPVTPVAATAATAPGAPTAVSATPGNALATVTFTAPASNGGSAITGYTVTSIPAGGVDSNAGSTALSHIITGLTNGTPYKFTVTATNTAGTGVASAASNSVTPSGAVVTPLLAGDLNGDKKVDVADALLALQFAIGLKKATATDLANGDVAPFVNGTSAPDGKIDIADTVAIMQKAVGNLRW